MSVRRWAFGCVSVVSFLTCAGVACLWVRSYWVKDTLSRRVRQVDDVSAVETYVNVRSSRGGLQVDRFRMTSPPAVFDQYRGEASRPAAPRRGRWARLRWRTDPAKSYPVHKIGGGWRPGWDWRALGFAAGAGNNRREQTYIPGEYRLEQAPGSVPRQATTLEDMWSVTVPHGFVVVMTAVPPTYWWVRRCRRKKLWRRRATGLCDRCGYDLRGRPASSGRCPECGNPTGAGQPSM